MSLVKSALLRPKLTPATWYCAPAWVVCARAWATCACACSTPCARLDDGGLRLEHLGLGLVEIGLVALECHLVVPGVELEEQSALFDVLVVVHPDLGYQSRNPRADLMNVPGGIGVVGAFVRLLVVQEGQQPDDEQGQYDEGNDDPQK